MRGRVNLGGRMEHMFLYGSIYPTPMLNLLLLHTRGKLCHEATFFDHNTLLVLKYCKKNRPDIFWHCY